ncbi:formylglycine-generating enzyme family protein [Telmatocola sphagniphila]|uniref:Formylglycine-generating enzyme family protein n=1 Tax=Telmatocola sphagniphila TaxID=1123043 RepID=A0A8E6EWP7_9BACT|nr:formylglycine-generating enzyme family protein [Telmatocola sphagniphila]QVL34012.1 formylglycine-generating enzyme family protein [Telmatocola sphagniphila]
MRSILFFSALIAVLGAVSALFSQSTATKKYAVLVGINDFRAKETLVFDNAEPKPGQEVELEIANGVKMKFCWIPPGKATLGSPESEKDRSEDEKEHEYTSQGYWLAKHPVTQEEWTAVMGTTPFWFHKEGDGKDKVRGLETGRFPAEQVSWDNAQEFIKKLNGKLGSGSLQKLFGTGMKLSLPHEDEWEYACRGGLGNKRVYYWGDSLNGDKANCNGEYPYGTEAKGENLKRTSRVGMYESKAPHPWGLCDMSGNVFQWCENKFDATGSVRDVRGGSWISNAGYCRSAYRNGGDPTDRSNILGFRLAVANR